MGSKVIMPGKSGEEEKLMQGGLEIGTTILKKYMSQNGQEKKENDQTEAAKRRMKNMGDV